MYLADYHLHSHTSTDAHCTMAQMARAAVAAGLQEICFTNHVEPHDPQGRECTYDWAEMAAEYPAAEDAVGAALVIRRGFEIGDVLYDMDHTRRVLEHMPAVDFLLASQHRLSRRFGAHDLIATDYSDPVLRKEYMQDYIADLFSLLDWGQFDVLAHLTLPVRYIQRQGFSTNFDGYEQEFAAMFRRLVAAGQGLELNTSGGALMMPEEKWLRLYRDCGGEIVTIGSDGHTTAAVGQHIREAQELLRACGFRYFATYKERKPQFYRL